jgi:hypothetical protein
MLLSLPGVRLEFQVKPFNSINQYMLYTVGGSSECDVLGPSYDIGVGGSTHPMIAHHRSSLEYLGDCPGACV